MNEDIKEPLDKCPTCASEDIYTDSPGIWLFLLSMIVFPITLLFLLGNRNRYCAKCGTRFKHTEQLN